MRLFQYLRYLNGVYGNLDPFMNSKFSSILFNFLSIKTDIRFDLWSYLTEKTNINDSSLCYGWVLIQNNVNVLIMKTKKWFHLWYMLVHVWHCRKNTQPVLVGNVIFFCIDHYLHRTHEPLKSILWLYLHLS